MKYLQEVFFLNFNGIVNNGGFISLKPEDEWQTHKHRFSQNKFYCITSGSCTIFIEGNEYIAKPGDWFFIPANAQHFYIKSHTEHVEKFWMHFDIYPTDTNLFALLDLPYVIHIEENDPAIEFFSTCFSTNNHILTDRLHIKAYLFLLIERYIILSRPQNITISNPNDERINEILRYINENLDKVLSNATLSEICHMHTNHFIRFFKKKTGYSPAQYIRYRKLEKAKQLLESTDLTISEIILKIGMDDISHFSKQFKRFYSMSPRQYKKNFNQTRSN